MSREKKYGWLNPRVNSAKTLIEKAKREIPHFREHIRKFEHQIELKSYAESTIFSYSRGVAQISLYFKKSPLDLEPDEINSYLYQLRKDKDLSDTYFKHTVYGLRMAYRLIGREDKAIRLPSIKRVNSLPVVLNCQEIKTLIATPKWKKHRILFALIYSAGLRISEVHNLEQRDIDMQRMTIHIRQSKYKKDRIVPLSNYMKKGLLDYYSQVCPIKYVFNGKATGSPFSKRAIQYIFRETLQRARIQKPANVHTLRHSYATHLLEQGVDILTIRDLLGHEDITTTMKYLHIAQLEHRKAHSPLDTLYNWKND